MVTIVFLTTPPLNISSSCDNVTNALLPKINKIIMKKIFVL